MKSVAITLFVVLLIAILAVYLVSFQVSEMESALVMTFGKPIAAPQRVWVDEIEPYQPPKKVKLSASPSAIQRALDDIERQKRLRAAG